MIIIFYNYHQFHHLHHYHHYFIEKWTSYSILGAIALLFLAYGISHITTRSKASLEIETDEFYLNTPSLQVRQRQTCLFLLQALITICIGCSTALFAWIINLSDQVIPVTVIGTIALSEYYHSSASASTLSYTLMLLMSTCASWITTINFTQQTLFYLIYQFNWHVMITMNQFSFIFSIIIALSILLPAIITLPSHYKSSSSNSNNRIDLLASNKSSSSSSSSNGNRQGMNSCRYFGNVLFEIIFSLSVMVLVALELIVREQVIF